MNEWRSVPGFDHIEANSVGEVRSTLKRNSRGHKLNGNRILRQQTMKNGYRTVTIRNSISGEFSPVLVHRLIAFAFHGTPSFANAQVRHMDGVRWHNHPENLRWGTGVENQNDRKIHGTHLECENAPGAKLSNADVLLIRKRVSKGEVQRRIAKEYGVSVSFICLVVKRRTYCHADAMSVESPLEKVFSDS